MAVRLNQRAYNYARRLIAAWRVEFDDRGAWSEHRPTTELENEFLRRHGFGAYALWFLGTDDDAPRDSKRRYRFPFGDFAIVHRCGVLSAESRAGQYRHFDVERAAAHLHGLIDGLTQAAHEASP